MISVIVPVLNEGSALPRFLGQPIFKSADLEIIFVDGGSHDNTKALIGEFANDQSKIIDSTPGRSMQMNQGALNAGGDILLFLHADTILPADAIHQIETALDKTHDWGRFDVRLDAPGLIYKVISWFINQRSRLSGIATGDQAIFVRKSSFENVNGFADQKLMEDIELSKALKRISSPACLGSTAKTSARKWQKEGVIKTVLLMWRLRAEYALGADPEVLWHRYYKLGAKQGDTRSQ